MFIIYVFIFTMGLLGSLAIGISISSKIENSNVYMIFWILYLCTIATFINIIMTIVYYLIMRKKKGPPGKRGIRGEQGERGEPGKCEASCKDEICTRQIETSIIDYLNKRAGRPVKLENAYIKQKIKQMCGSPEFKQASPYHGPAKLIDYLSEIWLKWIELMFQEGGESYFESIGAETEWEWVNKNPFNEIKKYDVYYWGLGKEYRPIITNVCDKEYGVKRDNNLKVCQTNNYVKIGDTEGVSSKHEASFWRAKPITYKSINYYPVGDIVIGPNRTNENALLDRFVGEISISHKIPGPNRSTILVGGDVQGPISYELIWDSTLIGSNKNIWIWRPIGPKTSKGDYYSLGDVVTTTSSPPPVGISAPIRCVPKACLESKYMPKSIMWSSEGGGGDRQINIVGFTPNKNTESNSLLKGTSANCYNLFRSMVNSAVIPKSDKNGSFYAIISTCIDNNGVPGKQYKVYKNPNKDNEGSGYSKLPKKNVMYSLDTFIKNSNKIILKNKTSKDFKITLESVNILNRDAYRIKDSSFDTESCLTVIDNNSAYSIDNKICASKDESQIFILELVQRNKYRIKHLKTNLYLIAQYGSFNLVKRIPNRNTPNDNSIFEA